jgi:hypothetical protein
VGGVRIKSFPGAHMTWGGPEMHCTYTELQEYDLLLGRLIERNLRKQTKYLKVIENKE